MFNQTCIAAVTGLALSTSAVSHADVIQLTIPENGSSQAYDQRANSNGTLEFIGQPTARVGTLTAGSPGVYAAYVIPFEVPTLAPGEVILSANLDFTFSDDNNFENSYNLDLYGVRQSADPTVLASDFYIGALDASATLLQDNVLPNTATEGSYETDAAGDTALVSYLSALTPGQYGFIRFSADDIANASSRWMTIDTADSATGPVLTITTGTSVVPEPASALLLGTGTLLLARRRRATR